MKTWKMHWDRQLYKALEHQYQMGLEALNENLPEIKVELVFRYSNKIFFLVHGVHRNLKFHNCPTFIIIIVCSFCVWAVSVEYVSVRNCFEFDLKLETDRTKKIKTKFRQASIAFSDDEKHICIIYGFICCLSQGMLLKVKYTCEKRKTIQFVFNRLKALDGT